MDMVVRAWSCGIVLVLAAAAGVARADSSVEGTASNEWEQAELALFDALRIDSSPRIQVLAGRLYVAGDDAASMLRPKRADVVARAANLAPDDAFVQWMAASMGNYYSSQCGPVHWPETEVAELMRLEPDNAGALLYSVALEQAKGDANGVDDALARMAAAKRADDHRGDEVDAWRKAFFAHPEATPSVASVEGDGRSPQDAALLSALAKVGSNFSAPETALESACKPDATSDRAWQRLGWCVDAGLLLARKGNSISLREQGLSLLAASGATPDDLAELRRDLAWLKANAANVFDNSNSYEDAPEDRAADWRDAPSEMVATERRLARLGLPSTPPAGWMPPSENSDESPEEASSKEAWQNYVHSLLEDMRGSADVHEKALALSASELNTWLNTGTTDSKKESTASAEADRATLIVLATAHPDDALVQWIAAASRSGAKRDAAALERLQRVDGDNAAVRALSLDPADADVDSTLHQIAASQRFDDHYVGVLGIWFAAVKRHPSSAEVVNAFQEQMPDTKRTLSQDDIAAATASMFATMGSVSAIGYGSLDAACSSSETLRRASCTAIGRLLFDGGHTLLTTMIGEMLLRKVDALDADDRVRARQLGWWRESMTDIGTSSDATSRYVEDTISTKSEIEALRLAMTRAGKAEPPADWKSPAEKRETKRPVK
jgi:hypothetical protein